MRLSTRRFLPVLAAITPLILASGIAAAHGYASAKDDSKATEQKAKADDKAKSAMNAPMYPELEIGAKGPNFKLKNVDGKMVSLGDYKDKKAVVVVFTCNACPYAIAYEDRLISLAKEYQPKGVQFVALNPNDPGKQPPDSFEKMIERADEKDLPYPYLLDEGSETAKKYGARVTPHIFLLDSKGMLAYRGRIDDERDRGRDPNQEKSADLKEALDAILSGKAVPVTTTKAFGCGVKWSEKKV